VATVVIPAHDEQAVIGRLLERLAPPADARGPDPLDLVVVCNGCTDNTAAVARSFGSVRVLETPVPSKAEAIRLADATVPGFPRVYLDADVELDRQDLHRLCAAVDGDRVLAASASRLLPRTGVSRWVRWYYDVWEQLPQVRTGIFGRGVIALSERGCRRVEGLRVGMSDDLVMSAAFTDAERRVLDSVSVVVHPPRTLPDLVRRRARVATGTTQAYQGEHGLRVDSRTSLRDLVGLARDPRLAVRMPVFLLVTVLARRMAARAVRSGDFSTWHRDESSRAAG
jgi:glycosyltransferase involved in cell wall biosynthesis